MLVQVIKGLSVKFCYVKQWRSQGPGIGGSTFPGKKVLDVPKKAAKEFFQQSHILFVHVTYPSLPRISQQFCTNTMPVPTRIGDPAPFPLWLRQCCRKIVHHIQKISVSKKTVQKNEALNANGTTLCLSEHCFSRRMYCTQANSCTHTDTPSGQKNNAKFGQLLIVKDFNINAEVSKLKACLSEKEIVRLRPVILTEKSLFAKPWRTLLFFSLSSCKKKIIYRK